MSAPSVRRAPETAAYDVARMLGWVSICGVIVYVVIDVVFAFLRPDYSLVFNAESDYGRGPLALLMGMNFLIRAALTFVFLAALHRVGLIAGAARAGRWALGVWAVCSGLLAFFPDDLEGQPVRFLGAVHLVLAGVAFFAIAVGAILVSVAVRSRPGARNVGTWLLVLSSAGAFAFLSFGSTTLRHHAPDGLYERIFLILELGWIAATAAVVVIRGRRPMRQK